MDRLCVGSRLLGIVSLWYIVHMSKTTHGMCYTPTYHSWQSMKARCQNKSNRNYGGKGIVVCERWRNSFVAFLADMGEKPSPRHTIERLRIDGNYEPGNCEWATYAEQNRNYGRNVLVNLGDATVVAQDADAAIGLRKGTIARRIKRGWTAERAMAAPLTRSRAEDLTGMRFGRFVVSRRAGSITAPGPKFASIKPTWECVCDCGTVKVLRADVLKGGETVSCGCYLRERQRERGKLLHTFRKKRDA
jgi:hypothetical protein